MQVAVPELELEVSTGTLGGLITTVEGLLDSIAEKLKNTQVWACPCVQMYLALCVTIWAHCILAAEGVFT